MERERSFRRKGGGNGGSEENKIREDKRMQRRTLKGMPRRSMKECNIGAREDTNKRQGKQKERGRQSNIDERKITEDIKRMEILSDAVDEMNSEKSSEKNSY